MKLFHISTSIIDNPDIKRGRKNADFNQGFYLSNDSEFSLKWASFKDKIAYLNIYELDTNDIKIKTLNKDKEWFEYIYNNRNGYDDLYSDYDVVIGPIANDTLYDSLGITTSGFLSKEDSYDLFILGNNYTQVAIKTLNGLKNLKFIEALTIKEEDTVKYKKDLKKEEDKYQKEFFKTLKKKNKDAYKALL